MNSRIRLAGLLMLLLALPCAPAWSALQPARQALAQQRPSAWAEPVEKGFNLYRMQADLYRSALPAAEAQPLLADIGIATVINFYQRSDADWLRAPHIRQVHLPLRTNRIDDADVLEVLRSIRQAQAQATGPVLIHCKHGQNRTGLIAAMYRIVYQGWSKEQALAEMRGGGFGGEQRLGDAERYVRRVDIDSLRTALTSGACSTSPWAWCALKARLAKAFAGRAGDDS